MENMLIQMLLDIPVCSVIRDNSILFNNTQVEPTTTVDILGADYNKSDLVYNNIQIEGLTTGGITLVPNELTYLSGVSSNIETLVGSLSTSIELKRYINIWCYW